MSGLGDKTPDQLDVIAWRNEALRNREALRKLRRLLFLPKVVQALKEELK